MRETYARNSSKVRAEMALIILLFVVGSVQGASSSGGEVALANVTRIANGDLFALVGSDCGPTRCMEMTHGTALAALGGGDGCVCQCRRDTPAFREDQRVCVNHIDECRMATFGRGATKPQIPYVFLPLKGQIIYPSKEIIFTDVDDAICAVTSAQYLSPSGWVTLRDQVDNDVPFSLYRDEGSTFLQGVGSSAPCVLASICYCAYLGAAKRLWRGSAALHARLEGRLVAAHVLCSAPTPARLAASCAPFRVAGASHNALLDISSIPFHAGEVVNTETATQTRSLSVLESLAVGVCVLMLIFVYAAGILFYIHYKQRQKRKEKDPEMNSPLTNETGSTMSSRIDMDNVMLKTNPLLKMDGMGADYLHDAGLSDVSEHTEDTIDSSHSNSNSQKFQKVNSSVVSAMVHTRRKKPSRPSIRATTPSERVMERMQRRSASPDFERAPHSELAIVDCSMESNMIERMSPSSSNGEQAIRRKLYFNPVFFETEHLKNPPPAAIEFLIKIREVMNIAKEKMTTKRFIPILSDIPEEESYHSIDLGWDIPCARRGRRFSAISLKRENSRRSVLCSGCPGCDYRDPVQKPNLARSNSCKTCVSEEYKQRIVRKWLDEVPSPAPRTVVTRPVKSIAKVSGTPRVVEPKPVETTENNLESVRSDEHIKSTRSSEEKNQKAVNAKDLKIPESMISKINELKAQIVSKKTMKIIDSEPTKDLNVLKLSEKNISAVKKSETRQNIKISEENTEKASLKNEKSETEPKIVNHIAKKKENNKNEQLKQPLVKPKQRITKDDIIISQTPRTSPTQQENISPSSEASRRIRKKLPPPPPPPVDITKLEINDLSVEEIDIPPEVKVKMEAVIKELNKCRRVEPKEIDEFKMETIEPIPPKIIIPVIAADTHYFSDDNLLTNMRKKPTYVQYEPFTDFDSMERNMLKKRRFSLACGPELAQRENMWYQSDMQIAKETLTRSWRDVRNAPENYSFMLPRKQSIHENLSTRVNEVFVHSIEPLYDNIAKPGSLTIQVSGSPVESRKSARDEFDPDTLDRKEKKKDKRVEKILLKSGGSFKYKTTFDRNSDLNQSVPEPVFTRKIGSLRQIYEAKAKIHVQDVPKPYYERRGSVPYGQHELTALVKSVKPIDFIRQIESQSDLKPPVPPKLRRGLELSPKFTGQMRNSSVGEKRRSPEERDRYLQYLRGENLSARRSGRRSNRTRSRRTDLRKLYRTEDSGYLSTDSNESKRRANYLMQLKSKSANIEISSVMLKPTVVKSPVLQHIESDTDDMESICDGRSESGGESIETDSVFFGNFDESKQMLAELDVCHYDFHRKLGLQEQIDSGFMGETNIILSGDSDSEHRSVISIVTGKDGRSSAASITQHEEAPYLHSVEC